jgi:hypothetical protein
MFAADVAQGRLVLKGKILTDNITVVDLPDGEKVAKAQGALVGHILQSAAAESPEWSRTGQTLKPLYLMLDPADIARSMKLTVARLQDALKVARVARPFIGKAVSGAPPALPAEVERLSLNAVIPFVLGDEDPTDPHNFEQRVFRRTLPVLHLAIALEQALMTAEAASGRRPSLEALTLEPACLPWIIDHAAALEGAVLAIQEFKVPEDRLLRVRLRSAG